MDPSSYGGAAADDDADASGSADGHGQTIWDSTAEHCEPNDSSHADATKFAWDCLNQDEDELLGLLGNQTPLRDCHDLFTNLRDNKETLDLEESRESKRRRTLEYPPASSQSEVGTHDTSSSFVTSEVATNSLLCVDKPQSLNCYMHHTSNNLDTINSLSDGATCRQEDNLLERRSYGTPAYPAPDQTPCNQENIARKNDQAGISGTSRIAPMTGSFTISRNLSTLKVSKGASSSLVKVKENLATSVAYPFTLIKPSWEEGDVTLHDINQRLRAPPKKAPEILGTSAFSGKPVIGKTRITTEGGKGSITILRTKG